MTPEGKIKQRIKRVLDKYEGRIYYYMSVPCGYGTSTLDYLGFFHGKGFAIEAKRPGNVPTARQEGTIEKIRKAGIPVFVVNDDRSLGELETWLAQVEKHPILIFR